MIRFASPAVLLTVAAVFSPAHRLHAEGAHGPLRVHPDNPRYFTDGMKMPDGSLKAVYLTGSHTWDNLVDTDHIWGVGGNAAWVWKSFLRGHNPIFMDPYHGVVLGQEWFDPVKGTVADQGRIEAPGGAQQFKPPFASDAVLHLKKAK